MTRSSFCAACGCALLVAAACGFALLAPGGVSAAPPAAAAERALPLLDNLTVRADVAGLQFRVEKEGVFQVYLSSTLPLPLSDVKLKVESDQFEATVAPAPSWKACPELPAVADGVAKGCFVVSLRRKAGSADDAPDVALRLYATCRGTRFLAATLSLAEALDEHRVPFNPSLKLGGQPSPRSWGNALVVKDFIACRKRGAYLVGYKSTRPGNTNQTRVYLAADDKNLYLLAATIGYNWFPPGTRTKIFIASARDSRPCTLEVDESTFQMKCDPAVKGAKCVRCSVGGNTGGCDAMIYQVAIPRKSVGSAGDCCYMNFARTVPSKNGKGVDVAVPGVVQPVAEVSCWRGNERSVGDPAVYAKMILEQPNTEGK